MFVKPITDCPFSLLAFRVSCLFHFRFFDSPDLSREQSLSVVFAFQPDRLLIERAISSLSSAPFYLSHSPCFAGVFPCLRPPAIPPDHPPTPRPPLSPLPPPSPTPAVSLWVCGFFCCFFVVVFFFYLFGVGFCLFFLFFFSFFFFFFFFFFF